MTAIHESPDITARHKALMAGSEKEKNIFEVFNTLSPSVVASSQVDYAELMARKKTDHCLGRLREKL